MLVNADLHIHSRFSIAVSRLLTLESLEEACLRKGIAVLGSGDAFHPEWRRECLRYTREGGRILLVPVAEVEGADRVHHLVIMEDFESFESLGEVFSAKSLNIAGAGRPHLEMSGAEIAAHVHDMDGLIGPAHAFTPWRSLYAVHDSVASCYGDERIDFLELGLSADSTYAACISELQGVPFLTNSDAHSAASHSLGREWNRLEIERFDTKDVLTAIREESIVANAGLFPELGKYNRTACCRCYRQFTVEDAMQLCWRCPCDGGHIKKGVWDRARELADSSPDTRPPYLHVVPLIDIVSSSLGIASRESQRAKGLYLQLIERLGNEIGILTELPISEIAEVNPEVAMRIRALRESRVTLEPGGGGRFGRISLEKRKDYRNNTQN